MSSLPNYRVTFIEVVLVCLVATTGCTNRAASSATRSVDPSLLAALDCNQIEPEWTPRKLSDGREIKVVSQKTFDLEKYGREFSLEYITDFNPRLDRCKMDREAWDILQNLRDEAEKIDAQMIKVSATYRPVYEGRGYGLDRRKDGTWRPSLGFSFRDGYEECEDHSDPTYLPQDILIAVLREDVQAIRALLDEHADVDGTEGGHSCGNVDCAKGGLSAAICGLTPLNMVAWIGDLDMVEELLRAGARVNTVAACATSPLGAAALRGHTEIFKTLFARGADLERRNGEGETPLIWAASTASGVGVRELLSAGANVNAFDSHGRTVLMHAVIQPHAIRRAEGGSSDCYLGIVQALLASGADPWARDKDGKDVFALASEAGDPKVLAVLPKPARAQ